MATTKKKAKKASKKKVLKRKPKRPAGVDAPKKAKRGYKPSVISTFAGGGGSSTGYHQAGCRELLAVEWDANACEVLRTNYPEVDVYEGDIGKLSVKEALERTGLKKGELDIFDGSPPCQGFSMSGKRSLSDDRNQLFREFVRLLKGLQPLAFVMENVTGMVRGKMRLSFKEILQTLEKAGYVVRARILNAASFGTPQLRERVIFIGARKDLGIVPTHPEPTHTHCPTTRKAIEGVPAEDEEAKAPRLEGISLACWARVKPGKPYSVVHPKGHCFNLSKADPNKPSRTIMKTARFDSWGCGVVHWKEPRALTIPELKRLGGFPDDYKFLGSFEDRWARIGNCVPPPLIKAVAEHVKKTIIIPARGRK